LIASSARQLRRMLGFSLWTVLGRLVQVAVLQGDKLVAVRVAGAVGLPSYLVPFNVAQRLNTMGSAAVTAVYPVAAGRRNQGAAFHESYFVAARTVHLLTAAPAVTLLVLGPLFLHSWIGAEMAASGAGFLRALVVGYWVMSVGSVEAGCLEGWGYPRLTALAASAGLGVAAVVATVLAVTEGGLWAIAGGVAAWMTLTGIANAIAWHRISRFPARRLWHELLRPVGEMSVIGIALAEVLGGWAAPGPAGLLACGILVVLLLGYGFLRMFGAGERGRLLRRLAGLAGRGSGAT
jgi:O-antigen/teichoic acid export membrane protein